MTVSCLDSPQVSPDFVEQMAEQYGEESNIYRVRVLGLPPTADDDAVIPRHLVESAIGREVEGIETVMPIWGLDVARMGGDRSALCKRRGNVVTEHIKTWRDKDLMELCGIVLTEYESTPYSERPSEIVIDSIGLGAGVVDRLVELDLPARGVNVAESSSMGQKFVRLRDELWWSGREFLEKRDCVLPQQDELLDELTTARFTYTSTGKLKIAGGVEGAMKESINRAFAYLNGHKVAMGIGHQVDTTDFHVEGIDLLANRVPCECGIALVVAIYSAIKKASVQPGLLILGDLSIQGNIKSMRSLVEPLQIAMENGARRALIPLENKRNFLEVSGDIVERVDPIFYSDPMTAAMKSLGMT